MNKIQKVTWVNFMGIVVTLAFVVFLLVEILIFKRLPETLLEKSWMPALLLLLMAAGLLLLRKRQSPREVESDERDKLIQKRAVLVAFVAVWVLLAAATLIPRLIVGIDGSIPVWVLPFINVTILLIVMLVYCGAVLIQYGRGGGDGQ